MLPCQIVQKLRNGVDAAHKKMIACARTGDIQQVALGVINLFKIGVVRRGLDPFLRWNYFIVASHNHDGPKLQTLRQMHSARGDITRIDFDSFIEQLHLETRAESPLLRGQVPLALHYATGHVLADKPRDLRGLDPSRWL